MSANPWRDPDPQPGDFDADLAKRDPRYVEHHDGEPDGLARDLHPGRVSSSKEPLPDDRACRNARITARGSKRCPSRQVATRHGRRRQAR